MNRRIAISTLIATLAITTAACGTSDDGGSSNTDTTPETTESMDDTMESEAPMDGMSEEPSMDDSMDPDASMDPNAMGATLVGAGCADYAEQVPDGAGSVEGMAQDPVAVAASNNPILTTLTAAVSGGVNPEVNLVDTLNGSEFTVFAPVDDAFAKIDQATLDTLATEPGGATLTNILTYHVVPGRIAPADIVGTQESVQGGTVEVAGEGDNLTVNGATVICGGVETANATVYLIDTVLDPAQGAATE